MGTLKLSNSSGNFVALTPPSSIASDVTLTLPNTDGDSGQYLQTNGTGTLSWQTVTDTTGWTWGDSANALSGTSVSVTGIPSTARRIIINFYEVSLDAAQNFFIRVGDSSGLASSGYFTRSVQFFGGSVYDTYFSSGWYTYGLNSAGYSMNGTITLDKMDGNKWLGVAFVDSGTATDNSNFLIGEVALSGTLDRVGLVTASGNFDNGKFFVSYLEP